MDRNVRAIIREIMSVHCRGILVAAIAFLRNAGIASHLQSFEILSEDEVYDTGNGVRSVHGGVAARHDIDALNEVVRDGVDIRRRRKVQNVSSNVPSPVDEGQRADCSKAAQVKQVEASDTDAEARVLLRKCRS
jgi:hypothetical protein